MMLYPPGVVLKGAKFSVMVVTNVLTSMRECQALLSLKAINPPLLHVILRAATMDPEEVCE